MAGRAAKTGGVSAIAALAARLTARLSGLIPDAGAALEGGRVRLGTLVLMRWAAVVGQTAALVIVTVSLGYDLPVLPCFLVVAASAAVNLHAHTRGRTAAWLGDRAATAYLGYDLLQLALLLGLTGGLINPFSILILAPVTVSASLLSRTSTLVLAALAIVLTTLLGIVHLPLPWPGAFHLPPLYVAGIWIALVLAVLFIAGYVSALARETQRRSDALAATQLALTREQRLADLGGLAAATAHELGTPLGTIAVVARELANELPGDSPYKEDADLLVAESARCRDILDRLAKRPAGGGGGEPYDWMSLQALVATAAGPGDRGGVRVGVDTDPRASGEQPTVPRSPEILHALGTLVDNAVRFADSAVTAYVGWDAGNAWVTLDDDGPGFAPEVLSRLGEPYITTVDQGGTTPGTHAGLGIFIARTLLARTGGEVTFANTATGARVHVHWPRERLEAADESRREGVS